MDNTVKQRFRFIAALAVLLGLSASYAHARRGEGGESPRGQRPAAWVSPQGENFSERAPSQAHGYEHAEEPPFEVQHFRRLSPEERRQLRRDIRNAGREVYRTRP